jgi:tetratricopeptide (TPR) repeat protein
LKVDKLTIPILLLVIIPIVFISPLKNVLLDWFNGIYIKPAVQNSLQQLLIPLKVFTKKPLTGTGPEMLHALYPQFITKAPAENSQTIYSPNFYLQILATTGILGFSTLLLSLTLIIKRSLKCIKELSVFKASIIGSMLLWIFTRLYSYPSITELFFGAVIFGSAIYLTRQKKVQSKQPRQISRVLLIFIALTAILIGYTIYSFEKAERLYAPARLNKNFAEISKTSKTIRLNPNEPTYYLAHSYNLIKLLNEDPGRSDQKEILRQFKLANRNAIALDRWRIDTYDKISDFYQILDQIYPGQNYNQHAVYYLQTAQNISPNNQFLKYQTANVYYLNNQPQPAISQLTKAIEIDHDYWEAYLFKANLLLDSQDDKDFDKAEALAETVIEKSDNTNYIEAAQNILLLIELRERS